MRTAYIPDNYIPAIVEQHRILHAVTVEIAGTQLSRLARDRYAIDERIEVSCTCITICMAVVEVENSIAPCSIPILNS